MQLLTKGNDVSCLTEDNEEITLEKMVGVMAASLYDNTICYMNDKETDSGKKITREDLALETMITNALSNALNATKK